MAITIPTVAPAPSATIIPRKSVVVFTPTLGIQQVETITCAAGNASSSANATVTVTGTGISGSPVAVTVALTSGDTPYVYAAKMRAALAANVAIAAVYTVGGAGLEITLTKIVAAANVSDLAIAITAGTTGITAVATSINTVVGVAAGVAVNIPGKVMGYEGDITEVEREAPADDGLLRPDRSVATEVNESITLEVEDVNIIASIFGGSLSGGLRGGTFRAYCLDPDDAAGTVAVLSNSVAGVVELDGGYDLVSGQLTSAKLKFTPLARLTLTADQTIAVPSASYDPTKTIIPRKMFVSFTPVVAGVAGAQQDVFTKSISYSHSIEKVERKVPDATDGMLRPDRVVITKLGEEFEAEIEDVATVLTTMFSGLSVAKVDGFVRILAVDPDDVSGSAALATNTFNAALYLDGGEEFAANQVSSAKIRIRVLSKLLIIPDATS